MADKDTELISEGLKLPVVEEFFSLQGKDSIQARQPILSDWEDVISDAAGAIPAFHGILNTPCGRNKINNREGCGIRC